MVFFYAVWLHFVECMLMYCCSDLADRDKGAMLINNRRNCKIYRFLLVALYLWFTVDPLNPALLSYLPN